MTVTVTDSVFQLKEIISKSASSAPPAESQRLLLKGKALTDSKLLKEYDISDGSIVHLYLKPGAAAPATTTTPATASTSTESVREPSTSTPSPPSPAPPSLTITTSVEDGPGTSMPLTNFDLAAPPTGPQPEITSATFHNTVADPIFWQKIHALCVTEFEHEDEADLAWEHFLRAMKGKLSAGEAAKIRDVVGVRGQSRVHQYNTLGCELINQVWAGVLKLSRVQENAGATRPSRYGSMLEALTYSPISQSLLYHLYASIMCWPLKSRSRINGDKMPRLK